MRSGKYLLILALAILPLGGCTPDEELTFEEDSSAEITRDAAKTAVKAIDKAKALQTENTIRNAVRAINLYQAEYMETPEARDANQLFNIMVDAGYLTNSDRLVDGWGNALIYKGSSRGFTLTSYGRDGQEGKGDSDWDADIIWQNGRFK